MSKTPAREQVSPPSPIGVPGPVGNTDIAAELDKIADLLDIEGANPFRVRAYRRAARLVSTLPRDVAAMLDAGENLDDLPGIGPDLAGKIAILARGGSLPMLDKLEHEMPPGIAALLAVPGLGPRRVHLLHEELGIDNLAALAAAVNAGKLRDLPRFGAALEAKILRALAASADIPSRTPLAMIEPTAKALLAYLRQVEGVHQVEIAGSFRRRRETVGDLDIVAAAKQAAPIMRHFINYGNAAEMVEQGPTRATIRLRNTMQVDLRAVPKESFGAAL
ncbi:MAG: helix-hairpin-helix domain-containing protein, partial [Acidobacteriota bacterium]